MYLSLLLALVVSLCPNGKEDRTADVMAAIVKLNNSGGGELKLEAGDYHFYSTHAKKAYFHVSNHDQPKERPIFLPLENMKNVKITGEGEGVNFVFHGMGTALLLDHTERVEVKNVTIKWDTPYYLHAKINAIDSVGRPTVSLADRDCVRFHNGRLCSVGSDWTNYMNGAIIFDGETHEVVAGTGDVGFDGRAESILDSAEYRLELDVRRISPRIKVGDVIVMRPYYRPHPVVCLNHAKDTVLRDFVFTDGFGMGILAQMSENVALLGGGTYPLEFGECASGTIDATHFSNCRGEIRIENCRFEGMMDDALNVHSTSLGITERVDSKTIKCQFMHHQAIGLDLFAKGDEIRFIAGKTLENGPKLKLAAVKALNDYEVLLTFEDEVPDCYQVGDAIENASYHPSVVFRGNKVGNNRARGILLTTPEKVTVEENLFDHVSGTAILLAGDAQGWYESGACRDVTIRKNRFVDCLTSRYQFCDGVIALVPIVKDPGRQVERYHQCLTIEDNIFESFDVPLLFAISGKNIHWRNNKVLTNERYPGWGRGRFLAYFCEDVKIDEK